MQRIIIVAFFLLTMGLVESQAQLNIKIGYDLCLMEPAALNKLLDRYNQRSDLDVAEPFNLLRVMHGGVIGARHRWEWFGLEAGWETRLAERNASGTALTTQQSFSRKLNVRYNAFSLLAGVYPGRLGFGGSMEAATFTVLSSEGGSSARSKDVQKTLLTSQFFLAYELPTSSSSAISFRPYIQVPWNQIDISGLENSLLPAAPDPSDPLLADLFSFGLQIIFYNGPQEW